MKRIADFFRNLIIIADELYVINNHCQYKYSR